MSDYTIDDLRNDFLNIKNLTETSPLYIEIVVCTERAYTPLSARLQHDSISKQDALQIAVTHLISPMSSQRELSPLEHYLVHEWERRNTAGQTLELPELRRILITSIRNALLATFKSGYAEALVERTQKILSNHPYVAVKSSKETFYCRSGHENPWADYQHRPEIMLAVANACSHIQKIPQTSEIKNSPVYSTHDLRRIVEILLKHTKSVTRKDIFELFRHLLTNWSPKLIHSSDDRIYDQSRERVDSQPADNDVGADEFAEQHAQQIWDQIPENERRVFHASTWNASQEAIAARVLFLDTRNPSTQRKYSRASIINFQQSLEKRLFELLRDFPPEDRTDIARALLNIATYYKF